MTVALHMPSSNSKGEEEQKEENCSYKTIAIAPWKRVLKKPSTRSGS
jgi:hypothetical protein